MLMSTDDEGGKGRMSAVGRLSALHAGCKQWSVISQSVFPGTRPWHASPKYINKELPGKESQENVIMLSSISALTNSQCTLTY